MPAAMPMPDALALLAVEPDAAGLLEARLIAMVFDSVTSLNSRRSYEKPATVLRMVSGIVPGTVP